MAKSSFLLSLVLCFFVVTVCWADLPAEALATAKKAVSFLTDQVSTQGGYLWRYSSDLKLREGEGVVTTETIWVQPPGTPSVGVAFVKLYEATGDQQFLTAARAAAEALRRGQMRSGGWQAMVEFEPSRRKKWAYRTQPTARKAKDQSSLDDDKTQSAIRFIVQLDRALNFEDSQIHEMALFALDGLVQKGQYPNGGFPQVWTDAKLATKDLKMRASIPNDYPESYPGHREYWYRYTLNDNLAPDVMETLYLAADVYQDARFEAAAKRLADFLVQAQLPDPQPAWAQQYSVEMQPIWARKFEPPAVTGNESQGVMETLMLAYQRTGQRKYLEPIPRALDYLEASRLPDGRLARFYELKTNRPLYFTTEYQLTYDDSDLPTHYGFKVASRLKRLRQRYNKLVEQPWGSLATWPASSWATSDRDLPVNEKLIQRLVSSIDQRGAWLSDRGLRYHKKSGQVIEMRVAVENLTRLAEYLSTRESSR